MAVRMSLDGGVWQLWRNAPGFSQRFKWDGNTLLPTVEKFMICYLMEVKTV